MKRFARIVLGYHGCEPNFADRLIQGTIPIQDWKSSENPYDWLGHGVYFWEHGPERARAWGQGGVVGAVIQLGSCLDLTDLEHTALLRSQYNAVKQLYKTQKMRLPENRDKRRDLDCLILNEMVRSSEEAGIAFETIRCAFPEGKPAFPGSKIFAESHIQLMVRKKALETNILGVFRPNLR